MENSLLKDLSDMDTSSRVRLVSKRIPNNVERGWGGGGGGTNGKDLFPYLKVPLDVRCLGMILNHWNRNANS